MGLLRIKMLVIPLLFLFIGCGTSGIKLSRAVEMELYPMFGKVPAREFYVPVQMSDSLRQIWEAQANGSFSTTSVTYYGENLFINDLSGRIVSFNLYSGKSAGQLKHKNPIFTTPVVSTHNLVYLESFSSEDKSILRIYNFITSKFTAEKELRGRVKTEILALGEDFFFITEKGLLYKYNAIGHETWMTDLKTTVRSGPVSDNVNLYVAADNGDIHTINLSDGKIIRTLNVGQIISSGLTIAGSTLFAGSRDGKLYAVDIRNNKVKWEYNSGSSILAVPVAARERIYTVNLGGDIISLDINSGEELWKTSTEGLLNSTPLLTENYLIVPDIANRLLFIDNSDGKEKKVIELPNRAKLSPVIYNNILIIGFDRGVIRAYEIL
jgi:outer membrane protein assembly factor BamB